MAYTDKGTVQNYLTVDIDSSLDSQVTAWIATVQAWIDKYVGKTFEAVSETRYYDSDGCREMYIDNFVGSPTIVILDTDGSDATTLTEGQGNDFITYPRNENSKNRISLTGNGSYASFPRGKNRIKVTASFGYSSSVPADVKLVATKLLGFILSKGIDGGKLSSQKLGEQEVTFEKIDEGAEAMGVYQTLDMYRDISI